MFKKRTARIFAYFKPYWPLWLMLFFITLFFTALDLINPLLVKFLIDDVLLAKNFGLFKILMLVFVGATLFSLSIGIVVNYLYRKLEFSIIYDVRNQLFNHIQNLHLQFFEKRKIGDLLVRLSSDISGIEGFVSAVFYTLILNVLSLIFILIICFILNWKVTLISLTVVPFFIFSQHYFAGKLRKMHKIIRKKSANLMDFFQERLSSIPLIKIFTQEKRELEQEKEKTRDIIKSGLEITLASRLSGAIIGIITAAALFYVLWYGGYQVIRGTLALGSLIAIYSYLGGLFGPIGALAGLYTNIQPTLVSIDRVFKILDVKPKIKEKPDAKNLPKIKGKIQFKNVSFNYNGKRIFKNLNLTINPGEKIGIVGSTGSGKTTLVNLILRLYEPQRGKILIDDYNIRDVTLKSLREQICLAQQQVILFNTSVKENISYGKLGVSFKEIKKASELAAADDFVQKLPQKYRTCVGVRGMALSGGEQQRISLARVFLKNPQIFLFDEATSSLDYKTEKRVLTNLLKSARGKTILVIAHRHSALKKMDRILVIKKKGVVEKRK